MPNLIARAVVLDRAQLGGKLPLLQPAQRACYDVLTLAVKEGQVFAALTGPRGCGKTTVLEAVLADLRGHSLRCIRVREPRSVSAQLAIQIEQAAYAEARKPDNAGRHVLLVIDDAHAASEELLSCLTRIAELRGPARRVPQMLLVGDPELLERLAADAFEPLARNLAIRASLPLVEAGRDPWASVEQGLMPRPLRLDEQHLIFSRPPQPGSLPPAVAHVRGRGLQSRLLVPVGLLLVSAGASAWSLSLLRGSDLVNHLSWAGTRPATLYDAPRSPPAQASSPRPPTPRALLPPPAAGLVSTLVAPPAPHSPAQASMSGARPVRPAPDPEAPVSGPSATGPSPDARPLAPVTVPIALPVTPSPHPAADVVAPLPVVTGVVTAPVGPGPVPPPPTANTPAASPLSPEIIALLLRRGGQQLANDDVFAARLLFQRAAEAGSAEGARRAGRTYDRAFLPPADAATLADGNQARLWYLRAAQLGDVEAADQSKTPKR